MDKNLQLNGIIHSRFKSETAMAQAMNWSRQRLNRITSGRKVPDIMEVNLMAEALGVPFGDMADIFLRSESTNVDK